MRTAIIAAALSLPALLTACGGSAPARHHPPAEPAAVKAMTVNQVELLCEDMSAVSQRGTGWTYARVVAAAVSFAPQMSHQQAVGAVAYVVHRGCPQYAHLLPGSRR
jgi:hypothetical protein